MELPSPDHVYTFLFAMAGALIGSFGRAIGSLISRAWTGAAKREKADYLSSVAGLMTTLRTSGASLEELRTFEMLLNSPAVAASIGAQAVLAPVEDNEPHEFQTTYGMKARAGAALAVAEAQLEQVLTDIRLLAGEGDEALIDETQAAWIAYRRGLENEALRQYEGGTFATLAMALESIAATETRIAELKVRLEEMLTR